MLSDENLDRIRGLAQIASRRGQSLAQMAVAWTLRDDRVTTTLLGASSVAQLEETVQAVRGLQFTDAELVEIDEFAIDGDINLWAAQSLIP
jgi:L-glyceraldehyde 3-phosphate reductase